MSRPRREQPRERRVDPDRSVLVPITQVPHLAQAAVRLGQTDRLIRVERAEQQVRTPGRVVGQWLGSGEFLPGSAGAAESAAAVRGGNALADALDRCAEREGMDR